MEPQEVRVVGAALAAAGGAMKTLSVPRPVEVSASMVANPGTMPVTRPVAETEATPGESDCHCTPDVIDEPALSVTESCVVWPTAVSTCPPETTSVPRVVEDVGVDESTSGAVGDEQAPPTKAAATTAASIRGLTRQILPGSV
jgi:hypothetical protein